MRTQLNWVPIVATQCGTVPLIEGPPGDGKTAITRALASAARRRFIQFIAGNHMPEDASGIPVPSDIVMADGTSYRGVTHLLGEEMLRAMHEPVVLLLDEFNQGGNGMMASLQEWVNNPPPQCWMIAVCNPIEQSTNGVEFPPPVINRMCVAKWESPAKSRRAGWRNGFKDYPLPDIPLVPSDYLDTYGPAWGDLLCQFEDRFPALFNEDAFPKDVALASRPWPSPRSWTNVGKLLAACDSVWANASTRAKCVLGCVGEGAGNQFLQWASMKDLPDPEDVLARPDQLKLPNRFDLVRTVLGGVKAAVKENTTPDRWERLYDVIEVVFDQQPESAMVLESELWGMQPAGHMPKLRNGAAAAMRKARMGA